MTGTSSKCAGRADLIQTIALVILNSDRAAGGWPVVESRDGIPNSDGYARNAEAVLTALHDAGYAIVPREPTEAMQEAGQRAKEADPYPANAQIYRAMIRAAITTGERNG